MRAPASVRSLTNRSTALPADVPIPSPSGAEAVAPTTAEGAEPAAEAVAPTTAEGAEPEDDEVAVPAETPSAAYARSPQRSPIASTPPTSRASCSARHRAAVRRTRRAAPGNVAGQVKTGSPPVRRNEVRVMSSESMRRGTDERSAAHR
ncbi:hypothetical protein [Streptomyces sp. NPDC055013]